MSSCLDILKEAILLERRGQALYQQVADQATRPEVKDFFQEMVQDEKNHTEMLSLQYAAFKKVGKFDAKINKKYSSGAADEVLNPKLKDLIEAASYEAAALSAAISMEKNAVELYSKRATEASDKEEILLYQWLTKWEQSHLDMLVELDESLREKVWKDNNFWPM